MVLYRTLLLYQTDVTLTSGPHCKSCSIMVLTNVYMHACCSPSDYQNLQGSLAWWEKSRTTCARNFVLTRQVHPAEYVWWTDVISLLTRLIIHNNNTWQFHNHLQDPIQKISISLVAPTHINSPAVLVNIIALNPFYWPKRKQQVSSTFK